MNDSIQVTFLPANKTVPAEPGMSVLDVAETHGIDMEHACGGNCSCATCHIYVESGAENFSGMEEDERERLETADNRKANSRLGCQAKLLRSGAQVTVRLPS